MKIPAFKNNGKITEIRCPVGLPKDSRPSAKTLFDYVKQPQKNYQNTYQQPIQAQHASSERLKSFSSHPTLANQVQGLRLSQSDLKNSSNALSNSNQSVNSSQNSLAAGAGKKKPPPVPPPKKVPRCTALYNYDATEADELSFTKGDVIIITRKDDPGWWTGTCNGKTGLFPSNVEFI